MKMLCFGLCFLGVVPTAFSQDSLLKRAGLLGRNYEDIGAFLTERNESIRIEVRNLTNAARSGRVLPLGVRLVDDVSIHIDGQHQPALIPVNRILLGFLGDLHDPSISHLVHEKLVNRGFPANEIPILMAQTSKVHDTDFFDREIGKINLAFRTQSKTVKTENEVRSLLAIGQRNQEKIYETWALDVLKSLSVPARRILIYFAFESICPGITVGLDAFPPSLGAIEELLKNAVNNSVGKDGDQ